MTYTSESIQSRIETASKNFGGKILIHFYSENPESTHALVSAVPFSRRYHIG